MSLFNKVSNDFKNLCTPAFFYLSVSVLILVLTAIQNLGNNDRYCLGVFECNVPNTFVIFVFKAIYILFWTFIFNVLCKSGYKTISWFLVLIPIVLLFVILGLIIVTYTLDEI